MLSGELFWICALLLVAILLATICAKWLVWALSFTPKRPGSLISRAFGDYEPMNWKTYLASVLVFGFLGIIILATILMTQGFLPLNPMNLPGVPFDLALNTAVSFVTNTNWQAYSGENTLSYFSQMVGLGTQNFLSAATGIAVMAALARGIANQQERSLGNFWQDLARLTFLFLLPLSIIVAVLLVSQGVIQNLSAYLTATGIDRATQILPMGPAASQIAIKQLGSNGGGFFGVNSAHPFENPTFFSNAIQTIAIILIPMACPLVFGVLSGARRHGRTLFRVMFVMLAVLLGLSLVAEFSGNPSLQSAILEGKEMRFGAGLSVLWSVITTASSNGSVNAMISSLSPLAGGIALLNIMLGEVVFGGVGSGVYGMFLFAVLTVFIAGLMVGRSPEFLGKKIEAAEIKLAVIGVLIPSVLILTFSAFASVSKLGLNSVSHPGAHGLSEILYAFSSAAGNNGSAFGGLNANTKFYNYALAFSMFVGRYGVIAPVIALAGLLSCKRSVPSSAGTFPVSGVLFSTLLVGVVLIVGALTFFPALTLGPVAEHLMMLGK